MVTRKAKNPELVAAVDNLADAAHHVRMAISQKIDAFATAAALELDKARQAAMAQGGAASRKFESLMTKAETQLTKATNAAKKSLYKTVRESERKLQAIDMTVRSDLARLKRVGEVQAAPAKAVARKAGLKKAAAKKSVVRKGTGRGSAA